MSINSSVDVNVAQKITLSIWLSRKQTPDPQTINAPNKNKCYRWYDAWANMSIDTPTAEKSKQPKKRAWLESAKQVQRSIFFLVETKMINNVWIENFSIYLNRTKLILIYRKPLVGLIEGRIWKMSTVGVDLHDFPSGKFSDGQYLRGRRSS